MKGACAIYLMFSHVEPIAPTDAVKHAANPDRANSTGSDTSTGTAELPSCMESAANSATPANCDTSPTDPYGKQFGTDAIPNNTLGSNKSEPTTESAKCDDKKSSDTKILHELSIASINIENVKTNEQYLRQLMKQHDIILLQEHWLYILL